MDISIINPIPAKTNNGLVIGKDSAPIKMYEFMNVRCPFCKQWFEEYYDLLTEYVNEGKVQRIIKLFDKEKESLLPGNVMHKHINYELPLKGLTDIRQIYATQDDWGKLSLEGVKQFAEDNLELPEMDNSIVAQQVITEAEAANIKFVPTVIVNEHIFDENITEAELRAILDSK
ncbi:DsbA family protein [Enterococcus sp. BWM-S5]|uniref:DsbA family protein n=1 Tax=Enterococcus larvae TaxID=2794352 RepID=A0ABS4CPJ0_9ENTE|nr:DsbA family protein [Enterococcus larvae]MBP1047679.1 DsbA family protein [Enterococcus larvae]